MASLVRESLARLGVVAWAIAVMTVSGTAASGDTVWLVSEGASGETPAGSSGARLVSADGRYVVVTSWSTGWVPGVVDLNGATDIYLWDRDTGSITLISHDSASAFTAGDGASDPTAISADGRYVAFRSRATNLIAGGSDTNGTDDAFLWDRDSDSMTLVSHESASAFTAGNGASVPRAISADGRYVAFVSGATNLIAGGSDTNGTDDTFLWDRDSGSITLVSHESASAFTAGNGHSDPTAISADGRFVAFLSWATNLIAGGSDTNGTGDTFLWDRDSGSITLVSHESASALTAGNGYSDPTAISADGRYVVLISLATNMIAGGADTNGTDDAFLWDRDSDSMTLVSHESGSALTAGNGASVPRAISADGRYVAFVSGATNLIAGGSDTNGTGDAFLWDRDSGSITLVSHDFASALTAGNGASVPSAISADGRYVAFYSIATSMLAGGTDTNGTYDAFLWDGDSASITLVSHESGSALTAGNGASTPTAISADGGYVAFQSGATNLIAGGADTNGTGDAFLWDRDTGSITLVSQASGGATTAGNRDSAPTAISADGRYVAFYSASTNLIAGGADTNGNYDALLWDRDSGSITLVSHDSASALTAGNGASIPTAISADGRYVAFVSGATNLIAGGSDTNGASDIYLWDRDSGSMTLVSHESGSALTAGNGASTPTAISADGRYVAFQSGATNLIAGGTDTNGTDDVFLWDRDSGSIALVSHESASALTAGNGASVPSAIGTDGRNIAFHSLATNLIAGGTDTNGTSDTFLWDRDSGSITLVSHDFASALTAGNGASVPSAISADGRYVTFYSRATNTIAGGTDTNSTYDVFLWDRDSGSITLVSHDSASASTAGNGPSFPSAISADGRYVAFRSKATNMIGGGTDTNGTDDAFLWDGDSDSITLVSHESASVFTAGNGYSNPTAISADGRYVAFRSSATNLIAGGSDTNGTDDGFLWDRDSGSMTLVSHESGSALTAGNGASTPTAISADGLYVAFGSSATDLMPGDFNGQPQAYLWTEGAADTTQPSDPSVSSTLPSASTWSNDATVEVTFAGAADEPGGSGLDGYSVLFDQSPATQPDATVDVPHGTDPHIVTSEELADGSDWYFHLSTCDLAGNCTSTVHAGPFWIDTAAPAAPIALASPTHGDGQPHAAATIDIGWGAAVDGLSGVDGYSYFFDGVADSGCETTKDVEEGTTTAASSPLADGTWYAHACAVDNAGNWGDVAHGGPYVVDTGAPTGLTVASPSHSASTWSNDATVDFVFSGATDVSGIAGYSLVFDELADSEPDTTVDQAAATYTGTAVTDGADWYLHARACDPAGNCGSTVHFGPFWIDTGAPSGVGPIVSPTHGDGLPKLAATVEVGWSAASDALSGVAGYRYEFLDWYAVPPACGALAQATTELEAISTPLTDGTWYLAICAQDNVGNEGALDYGYPYVVNLQGTATTIFWANWALQAVGLVQSDGTGLTGVGRGLAPLMVEVDLAAGHVYWTEYWAGGIFRSDLDFGNELELGSGLSQAHGLALDLAAGTLYFTQRGTGTVSRMNLDGTGLVDLVAGLVSPHDLELDLEGGKVYWADEFGGTVQRANLDGSEVETLASAQEGPTGIALDLRHGQLFWTERWMGRLNRSNLDGSSASSILTGLVEPLDVDYVAGEDALYLTEIGAEGWLSRVDRDGSSYTHLVALGGSPEGIAVRLFHADSQAPSGPSAFAAQAPHAEGAWSNQVAITMEWSGAADEPGGSGLEGYSVLFDQIPDSEAGASIDLIHEADPHASSAELGEGAWYFHLSACDFAGNCGPTMHRGPYGIDQAAPTQVADLSSPSHGVGTTSGDDTIDVSWNAASDALSGVTAYGWAFDQSASWSCDGVADGDAATLATSSNPLGSGSWWFHACAVDAAGNWGAVADLGPFPIDASGPQVVSIGSVAATEDDEIAEDESLAFGPTQLLVRFSEPMDPVSVEATASYRLAEAGDDGVLESLECEASPSGDDLAISTDWALYVEAELAAALGVESRVPLPSGSYRLLVCPTLEDAYGNPLQMAPSTRDFAVTGDNLLINPNVDGDLGSWQAPASEGAIFAYSAEDSDGNVTSGSARSAENPIGPVIAVLSQCVPGSLGAYRASTVVRASGTPHLRLRATGYPNGDCSGPALGSSESDLSQGGTSALWINASATFLLSPGSASMSLEVRAEMPGGEPTEVELDRLALERALFGDGFETGDLEQWSSSMP